MTLKVWKYPLQDTWVQTVEMPKSSNIIHVGEQRGAICLWAEVDTEQEEKVKRTFYLVGTGNEFPKVGVRHIGTVMKVKGSWPYHVYQEVTKWMTHGEIITKISNTAEELVKEQQRQKQTQSQKVKAELEEA